MRNAAVGIPFQYPSPPTEHIAGVGQVDDVISRVLQTTRRVLCHLIWPDTDPPPLTHLKSLDPQPPPPLPAADTIHNAVIY